MLISFWVQQRWCSETSGAKCSIDSSNNTYADGFGSLLGNLENYNQKVELVDGITSVNCGAAFSGWDFEKNHGCLHLSLFSQIHQKVPVWYRRKNALLSGQRSVLSRRLNKDQNQQQCRETSHNTMKHKLMITRKDLSSDVMSLRPCRSSIRCTCPKFFMKSDPAPSTRARDSSLFRLADASYSCNYFQVKIRKWTKSPNIWKADSDLLLDPKEGVLGFPQTHP